MHRWRLSCGLALVLCLRCEGSRPQRAIHRHRKGVDEDFKSLATNLDQYATLLNTAKSAEQSAEEAATNFAVENPKDFAHFQEKVQSAAAESAKLLEKANEQVLKKDEEIPRKALEEADAAANAND
mmetsp:Transcript_42786/g.99700  ORF Transcript_42786/g.99700 Transcript_42786/m.99700 type:complete len:126 (+) Transcript_42786:104-481(+)